MPKIKNIKIQYSVVYNKNQLNRFPIDACLSKLKFDLLKPYKKLFVFLFLQRTKTVNKFNKNNAR